ncbi:MAG TPA: BamA/TamA family outer membrane protein [Cellvibrio sp.]|nr:BamA/TamA family outer membrane protein [Cellvibrio sp.]
MANQSFAQEAPLQENSSEECTSFNVDPFDIAHKKSSRVEASPFEIFEGKTIRNIRFQQMTIFDPNNPDENNKLYLLLNKLHVKTRTKVVASQLLFKVGDKVNHKRLEETARNLRTRKYLTNAYVLPEKVCGDAVDVVVITQDAWAIEPQVSFSHKSSDSQTGFAISDANVFGTGNSFKVGYNESELRSAVSYELSNPYFLNKQIAVRVVYQDTSDGRNSLVSVARPFYSLDSPWASGLQISDLSQVEEVRSRGEVINTFSHQAINNEIYYGKATDINEDFTQRWLVGFTHEEDTFEADIDTLQPIPQRDKAVYPWVEYQYLQNKYGVFKNLNQIQRPEDIAIGQTMSFRFGFAGTAFGNQDDVFRYIARYSNIIDFSDRHLLEIEMGLDGRQHLKFDELDPNIFTSSVAYHYLQDEKNRWYARFEFGAGESLPQYKQLTVGDITGLRGYPTDYLRGDRRYVITLERRYFSDVHIFNLMRVGGVVFFDAGKAWGLPSEPKAPLLSNVGIGLRLSSTKVRIGNIIHVDVAMPTSASEGLSKYQLTIGAFQKF